MALRVGFEAENPAPPIDSSGLGGVGATQAQSVDLGSMFADALRDSRLFQDVRYPVPDTLEARRGIDLTMNASFKRAFRGDPAKAGKAIVTGLLLCLPMPFVVYEDQHSASGRLAVNDKDGKWIKEYSQTADLTAVWKIFSEGRSYREGPRAAARAMVAQLVEALIADRALYEKLSRDKDAKPAQAAQPPEPPEPQAAAEPPQAPASAQAKAEPQAAPAPPEAKAPEPQASAEPARPKAPSQSWDDQLLP